MLTHHGLRWKSDVKQESLIIIRPFKASSERVGVWLTAIITQLHIVSVLILELMGPLETIRSMPSYFADEAKMVKWID